MGRLAEVGEAAKQLAGELVHSFELSMYTDKSKVDNALYSKSEEYNEAVTWRYKAEVRCVHTAIQIT